MELGKPMALSQGEKDYPYEGFATTEIISLYYCELKFPLSICGYTFIIMSTPFKGGSTYCFTAVSVSVSVSVSVLSHPKAPPARFFFWVHQNMIPAIQRSFSTGDLNLQGQGQACRGHHLKNHLN